MKLSVLVGVLLLFALRMTATNYYSDPVSGSMSNSGAGTSPWGSLSDIFTANKKFEVGDTIFLRTGNHGYAVIKGVNTGFVVIMPETGHSPVISRVRISSTANSPAQFWKLSGLTIQSQATGNNATPSYYLLEVYPYATDITISGCTITSDLNTAGWTREDWRNRCNSGIFTRPKLNANILIENNLILNTAFGLAVGSSHTIVRNNTVQYFTNDGSRVLGSHIIFEHNRIMDLMKVMTKDENHDDLFQSFTNANGVGQDTLRDNIIRANLFLCASDTSRPFRGAVQGIGCFDGPFLNWTIENNIVICDHWHGISMYGAIDCKIINNTVMDPYVYTPYDPSDNNPTSVGPAWIRIDKKNGGPGSINNTVNNNLVAASVIIVSATMGAASNNIVIGAVGNYSSFFVNADDLANPSNFDLHLKGSASAVDAGISDFAPLEDYDGNIRPKGASFDVGAFEYDPTTSLVQNLNDDLAFACFPNPSTSHLTIESKCNQKIDRLQLCTLQGRLVLSKNINDFNAELNLSGLSDSVYFLKIYCGNVSSSRLIVVH